MSFIDVYRRQVELLVQSIPQVAIARNLEEVLSL